MKVLTKVTLASMRENRTRTIVTIVGVILSAAMFTAVTSLLSSAFNWGERVMIDQRGNYHFAVSAVSGSWGLNLAADDRVDAVYSARELGYAEAKTENTGKPYFYVLQTDAAFFENMPVHLTEGRYPQNRNEILLPEHYLSFGGVKIPVGGTISLNIGSRQSDGENLNQNNPYDDEIQEQIVGAKEQAFTVAGYYERPVFENYTAPGYTALTGGGSLSSDGIYEVYFRLSNPSRDTDAVILEHEMPKTGYDANWELLAFQGVSKYSNIPAMLVSFGCILLALIFIGSVSLIYSVFSISVGERTRQFGILSSVGATAKQIRRCVYTEAALVSLIGIPIGCLSGIVGIGITLRLLGESIGTYIGTEIPLTLVVHPLAVAAAVLIAAGTVFLSARVPARRAMRASALEAIRQTKEIKVSKQKRSREFSTAFLRRFGIGAALAQKYFHRSRRKYANTILALAMSVVLFVSAGAFIDVLIGAAEDTMDVADHDIRADLNASVPWQNLQNGLNELDGVKDFAISQETYGGVPLEEAPMTEKYIDHVKAYSGDEMPIVSSISILYLNDEAFDALLPAGADKTSFYDASQPVYLLCNHASFTNEIYNEETETWEKKTSAFNFYEEGVERLPVFLADEEETIDGYNSYEMIRRDGVYYRVYVPADSDWIYDESGLPVDAIQRPVTAAELSIGAVTDALPMGYSNIAQPLLVRPLSSADASLLTSPSLFVSSADAVALQPELEKTMENLGVGYRSLHNYAAEDEAVHAMLTVVQTFAYGFIILISLLSAANVFNTISTNIALRRRDYAMLGSIGMDRKGLIRMMNYECLIYGTHALLIGLPLSVLTSLGIRYLSRDMVENIAALPWKYFLIAAFAVFAVVFSSMLYSFLKLKKDNPVDTLKNENI